LNVHFPACPDYSRISDLITVHGLIQEEADEDANIIFGAVIDESMGDEVRITVIATGFGEHVEEGKRPAKASVAAAPDGRPIRRLGLLDDEQLEVPAYQRRGKEPPVIGSRARTKNGSDEDGEDFEVPTFLRPGAE
jgi:cell division protein FtsZ